MISFNTMILDIQAAERDQANLDQISIAEMGVRVVHMLLEKNKAYGSSIFNPINIFAKDSTPLQLIHTRIDDKLSRLARGSQYAEEDAVLDLVGYLILELIAREQEKYKAIEVTPLAPYQTATYPYRVKDNPQA